MDRRSLAILAITGLLLFPGCRAHQLASDQNQFRQILTTMYEDQLMDNLIRAKTRMPLLQLDYSNITGTVSDSGVASFGATPGTTTTTTFAPVVATRSLVRAIARPFSYGLSETR